MIKPTRLVCWCIMSFLLVQLVAVQAADPQDGASTARAKGSLLVGGGGRLPDAVYRRFVELAGGKAGRLVLIPTASEDDSWLNNKEEVTAYVDDWKDEGIDSVTILHTRERGQADRPDFALPLTVATGVWLGGGDQALLEKAYVGTLVEKEIYGVLARGGIVGGSSAGAAIQSRVMIRCGDELPEIGTGFDLVPAAIVDQHFLMRNRVNRLFEAVRRFPDRIGIGIDEQTAVLIRDGRLEVLGDSYVMFVRMAPANPLPQIQMKSAGESMQLRDLCAVPGGGE
jgi:cyanophycinase